jgi:hypothetical protein
MEAEIAPAITTAVMQAFAEFGMSALAYVKPIKTGGYTTYAVYAANGSFQCECLNREELYEVCRGHEIKAVSVH